MKGGLEAALFVFSARVRHRAEAEGDERFALAGSIGIQLRAAEFRQGVLRHLHLPEGLLRCSAAK